MDPSELLTEHPLYPVPTLEQYEDNPLGVQRYLEERYQRMALEAADPFRYGYIPPVWNLLDQALSEGKREILILGGNRATKTYCAARKVVDTLTSKKKAVVWCLQETFQNSVEMQQPAVWNYLPPEFKDLKRGRVTNISYTQKMGFSQSKFVLPNGSECIFRHYSQREDTVEGGSCDLIWADELVPLQLVETLRYRLISREGWLLMTFTPKQGYSPTVKEYLEGAKTLTWEEAPLLPPGAMGRNGRRVPRVQEPVRSNARIIYFFITDNPFTSEKMISETLEGASTSEILCRAYGYPTKAVMQRFPRFGERHIIDKVPEGGTNYLVADPASERNWFMLWVRVIGEVYYVYREWPASYVVGIGEVGMWAEPDGKLADGHAGPAQQGFGWGLKRYIEEITRLETEQKEVIVERWMDSRFGNTPSVSADSGTTLLEECARLGMFFQPAPNDPIEEGVSMINSLLDYDESEEKSPHLLIHKECQNLIFALRIWTGRDSLRGASKDPIDCLRWAAVGHLADFHPGELTIEEGGAY